MNKPNDRRVQVDFDRFLGIRLDSKRKNGFPSSHRKASSTTQGFPFDRALVFVSKIRSKERQKVQNATDCLVKHGFGLPCDWFGAEGATHALCFSFQLDVRTGGFCGP